MIIVLIIIIIILFLINKDTIENMVMVKSIPSSSNPIANKQPNDISLFQNIYKIAADLVTNNGVNVKTELNLTGNMSADTIVTKDIIANNIDSTKINANTFLSNGNGFQIFTITYNPTDINLSNRFLIKNNNKNFDVKSWVVIIMGNPSMSSITYTNSGYWYCYVRFPDNNEKLVTPITFLAMPIGMFNPSNNYNNPILLSLAK